MELWKTARFNNIVILSEKLQRLESM